MKELDSIWEISDKTYEFKLAYEIDWACVQTDIWNFQIVW